MRNLKSTIDALVKLRSHLDWEVELLLIKMIYSIYPLEIIISIRFQLDNGVVLVRISPFHSTLNTNSALFGTVWLEAGRLPVACPVLTAVLCVDSSWEGEGWQPPCEGVGVLCWEQFQARESKNKKQNQKNQKNQKLAEYGDRKFPSQWDHLEVTTKG